MVPRISLTADEQRLRSLLLDVSEYISTQGESARPQLRFTGGWVRDKVLGIGSHDVDIAVDNMTGMRFAEYMREFACSSEKAKQYGADVVKKITKIASRPEQSKHLETATLTVFGFPIDITNLRKEVYDDVTRNPQMEFGTAEEDALRRDATINALFYNLQEETVEDLTRRGIEDLNQQIIRTPLDPFQTFKDDPLRILRCIRFACRFGYKIEDAAVKAMAIPEIREALRVKITRERIGVEMEKMFKGPRVVDAYKYIEDANLYPIVFSNPAWDRTIEVELEGWRLAYEKVDALINKDDDKVLLDLRQSLITTKDEEQTTWICTALVPYSPLVFNQEYTVAKKAPKTLPALIAREGLKAENKIRDNVDAAFSRISELINLKNATSTAMGLNGKANDIAITREAVGILFNDWGPSWRLSIITAMISELMACKGQGLDDIIVQYHTFLKWIQKEDLLKAHELKPLIDGRRLLQEVGRKPGPWTRDAIRVLLEWQFRNPGVTDPSKGIAEVVSRFGETAGGT